MDVEVTTPTGLPPIDASRLMEARVRRDARRSVEAAAVEPAQDEVSLSALAQQIARLNTVAAASAQRTELIDELRALIKSGDYQVDPDAVAARLLDRSED